MTATFYLGTHQPSWLFNPRFRNIPLFVSSRRLAGRKSTFPRALGRWALDSGAFTEIRMYGHWTITPAQYLALVCRYIEEIGMPDFVAPMDWMCEPWVISGKNQHLKRTSSAYFHGTRTARGIPEDGPDEPFDDAVLKHQRWTIDNYLELCDRARFLEREGLAPAGLEEKIAPSLQAWTKPQYLRCRRMYASAGVDLESLPVVGLGSVCRRQATSEIAEIVNALVDTGLDNLHGFGVKTEGLGDYGPWLTSADSQAWSAGERYRGYPLFPKHADRHKNCANCPDAALLWYSKVLNQLTRAHALYPSSAPGAMGRAA
ncbi:DUF7221 family queuine tRNA-ribosyltransferase-like protein [Streptosporangium sp. G11]|uniref:deazapurine DNA modification protein DpdA family protein n=1 Tax=Streptosporangium sp. G11 TaxID=3436926 RepID=UPI003EBA525F